MLALIVQLKTLSGSGTFEETMFVDSRRDWQPINHANFSGLVEGMLSNGTNFKKGEKSGEFSSL